jgi:hypothetical protein
MMGSFSPDAGTVPRQHPDFESCSISRFHWPAPDALANGIQGSDEKRGMNPGHEEERIEWRTFL